VRYYLHRLWLILVFLLPVLTSQATPSQDGVTHIPLKRAGNLFLIEAQVDSLRGNFILDLGAPYIVLNSTYFRNYVIDTNYRAGTLTSESDFVRRTKIEQFVVQDIRLEHLDADVADLAHIENQRQVRILGLIGISFFKDYIMEMDLSRQQLILHQNRSTSKITAPPLFRSPLKMQDDVLWISAKFQGKKLRFSLDTGAELNIIDSELPDKVYDGLDLLETKTVRGTNGAAAQVLLVLLPRLEINGFTLQDMRTLVVKMQTMSRAYGKNIHGMLGFPFFSQGRFVIDFKNKELEMYPSYER